MKLDPGGSVHLSYCTNVHPGETLEALQQVVKTHAASVRQQLGLARFGVGLRLANQAAVSLEQQGELECFKQLLHDSGLYVFTLNGFPYGVFHGTPVKEQVYEPDWRSEARLIYTDRLARILAALLPVGTHGSISTVPLGYRPNISKNDEPLLVTHLLRHVALLHELFEETGKHIELGLEPEPHCYLETLSEAAEFLQRGPFSEAAIAEFARMTGLGSSMAEETLRRHLGVCLDACHMTVEFEDPLGTIKLLRSAGIRITKLQVSVGLVCSLQGERKRDAANLQRLHELSDAVYLHQVVERRAQQLFRYVDLPAAIAAYEGHGDACEWRIHFHVPVFMRELAQFQSTQNDLQILLAEQRRAPFCSHLEVETYTWDVLPESARQMPLTQAIARELNWTLNELGLSLASIQAANSQ